MNKSHIRNRKIILLKIIVGIMVLTFSRIEANAEEINESQNILGFSYQLLFPENQIDSELGYYHLKTVPGVKQTIELSLSNTTDEMITIRISLNSAKTTQNGEIEYGDHENQKDASLDNDFQKIFTGEGQIDLKARETRILKFELIVPEESYEGIIVGGIQLTRVDEKSPEEANGTDIINQYAYVIAVLLQESETVLEPEMQLHQIGIDESDYYYPLTINFANTKAVFVKGMTVDIKIRKKGQETILYQRKQSDMMMAPNSYIAYPVFINEAITGAGDYVADVTVTCGERNWFWRKGFFLSQKQIDYFEQISEESTTENRFNWLMFFLLGSIFLLIAFFGFFNLRKVKKSS